MKKQTKIIISALFAVILATAVYLVKNYDANIGAIKNPVPPISTTINPATKPDTIITKHYTNKQYGFSFDYSDSSNPDSSMFIKETPQGVSFSDWEGGMGIFSITVDPTTFTDPKQEVNELNRIAADEYAKDKSFGMESNVIEKSITIDGIPAIVVYQKSLTPPIESYKDRQVYFIKDKLLYRIATRQEDDALWSSFKFTK